MSDKQKDKDEVQLIMSEMTKPGDVVMSAMSGVDAVGKVVLKMRFGTGMVSMPEEFLEHNGLTDDATIDVSVISMVMINGDEMEIVLDTSMGYQLAVGLSDWIDELVEGGRLPCPCGEGHKEHDHE